MRPRSSLLAKRSLLLPTISEGYEELTRSQANLSSEDYLQSICQLACPPFPPQGSASPSDVINARQKDSLNQRLSRLNAHDRRQATFDPDQREQAHGRDIGDVISARQGGKRDGNEEAVFGCHGTVDPLEYLYGYQENPAPFTCQSGSLRQRLAEARGGRRDGEWPVGQTRPHAYSFSRSCPISHHKSSCPVPTLHPPPALCTSSLPHTAPQPAPTPGESHHTQPASPEEEGRRQGGGGRQKVKQSLMSQWMSDWRGWVWREGGERASAQPVIDDM
ncbi:uncharacterized protein si:dkeyp-72g9.4 [Hypomesus transpacificus]|uniref:uncharacterized protein si:dkeyp-72g9.4 n=1 Tax=Hypomesus transpacificus TaxID=137520 RepID=UPI001F088231|nr:uncharacterized protein si:dkeyp-72g9.4 [Hypomesus transpacificus]